MTVREFSGVTFARAWADQMFKAKLEGRPRQTIYDQKRLRPLGKFYYVCHEFEHYKKAKKPTPVLYVTYYDFGNVYNRSGKR